MVDSALSVKSVATSNSNGAEPMYQVKLLSALRSGDPALIHPFLAEIGKDRRTSIDADLDTGAAALHLAIRCSSADTVALLLSHRAISPNGVHPPGSGTTPLHLAASLGRVDIVNLLFEQDSIDDTLRDGQGRTCKDVARSKDVIRAIDDSRSFLNASYRSLLHSYILSPPNSQPPSALVSLLESRRISFVDLSYLDDDSGTSLLHEAARRKNLRLIELAVRSGADVFVRNRKGKTAYEGAGKDDQVRVFLRQYANHDNTLINSSTSDLPTLRGYLNKYTNVAKGYNTRWFVLKGGVVSYYRHQEDEAVASRGSISMKNAMLKASHDRLRFEVHSIPMRASAPGQASSSASGSGSVQKWYMKANHPVEAARWSQAIERSISFFKRETNKDQIKGSSSGGNTTDGDFVRRKSAESDSSYLKGGNATSVSSCVPPQPSSHNIPGTSLLKKAARGGGNVIRNIAVGSQADSASPAGKRNGNRDSINTANVVPVHSVDLAPGPPIDEGEEEDVEEDTSSADTTSREPPHEGSFELQANSTTTHLDLTMQLFSSFVLPADIPSRTREVHASLGDSLNSLKDMIKEYVAMVNVREVWWKKKLEEEMQRQRVWEESLALVVKEGEDLEKELRARSRRRGSRFFDVGVSEDGVAAKRVSTRVITAVSPATLAAALPKEHLPPLVLSPLLSQSPPPTGADAIERPSLPTAGAATGVIRPHQEPPPVTKPSVSETEDVYTDEEDEFFDAIESNNLPNLVVHESFAPSRLEPISLPNVDVKTYLGYQRLRQQLAISADNRPSTSLWSVLKHSIGKDLTRISFPVFFNEPTSMLQRMAEDMEFSECLDAAARESDPLRRIAFVAAFAMSNYSSTIGRIAKPFNPMLSETFEYVRLDKQYRYMSEQVSHHPPISACWAESPLWHYYGEVDAQNKFMGKSFEIRPTGVAHAELVLPQSLGPGYPKAPSKLGPGKVLEHYTWKKVTTNVSGFILGSPTIDHYGDMVVTNHRTGDQCILTFKPRGWRGKDAYEITGKVMDASENVVYEIAGRWNSQLVARQCGVGNGYLNPDTFVSSPRSSTHLSEFILLWRNSEKPAGMPFNLTPYAITLNDCPKDTLRPYLTPTDCRLRPDQRAFELGKYELANGLKVAQEEKQRAIRKAREEGRIPPHKPRWFIAETDGDTGDRVWSPVMVGEDLEYWVERENVFKLGGKGTWKGVEDIFIEEPDSIRGL
ncbi:hypothetical protein AX17_005575 [Amanita inopinata Kibby_2008]|nr:hypothetical protein AX17_005575 [Amanita inopinata Kibby_2008]